MNEQKQEINTYTALTKDNRLLILKRKNGIWEFPGGKVEWGETPKQGAYRECKEETGIEPEDLLFVGTTSAVYEKDGDNKHSIYLIYLGRTKQDEIKLSHEHTEYRWLGLDELKFIKLGLNAEPVPELIEDILSE